MKQISCGLTDFVRIQKDNCYYVDKTILIKRTEMQPAYLFLIRPRRFGKSLTLAMLKAHYDIVYTNDFDGLFGCLYIGQHPTPKHNCYLIMRFSFSEVSSNVNKVKRSFKLRYCSKLRNLMFRYEDLLGKEIWDVLDEEIQQGSSTFLSVINSYALRKGNLPIYLLIDEYDSFTNTILLTYGTEYYQKATHNEGFVRGFFDVIKTATTGTGSVPRRMFITEVSPVTMDDITSGFNIRTNTTTDPWSNDLVGLNEAEPRKALTYYKEQGVLMQMVGETIVMMKPSYGDCCSSRSRLADCMFNSDMALYLMKSFVLHGEKPDEVVDPNIRTDFNKLVYLIRLGHGLGENFPVIKKMVERGEVATDIATHSPALKMTDIRNFKSLLFCFGPLSIKRVGMTGRPILYVPDLVVREQFFSFSIQGYIKHDILKIDVNRTTMLFENMVFRRDRKPSFNFITETIRKQNRIRGYIEGEACTKGFLLAYLGIYRYYRLYPEYELNEGSADFLLKPSPLAPVMPPLIYLLEAKYAKAGVSKKETRVLADGTREQLLRYSQDELITEARTKGGLRLIMIAWCSWEFVLLEEVLQIPIAFIPFEQFQHWPQTNETFSESKHLFSPCYHNCSHYRNPHE